ncbi:phosphatase PAP2 family protein [Metabacillus litoralis]|uniref:Undecaprenyl-diphosphatase n=1 Tax=Metabacillus litoralis TaxID=152268 RepID=A0A179SQN0_9BACI|nr:phosphatase PAP2 family protein [Metabacillus litoralis]OAS83179.1 undecaprenyl-diphosphatase [Metabacillus litoralis]
MDQRLFKWINDLAGKNTFLDNIMIFASNKMRYIFAFVLFLLWQRKGQKRKVFYRSLISLMINLCINVLIKQYKFRPRPFITRKANLLIPSKLDSTIISKHTLLAFAVSTMIFISNKIIGFIMIGLSVLIGVSRIWTGAHYPFDVVRSAFIGSIVSIVVNMFSLIRK